MDNCYCAKIVRLIRADSIEPDGTAVIPAEFLPEIRHDQEAKLAFGLREVNIKLLPGRKPGLIKLSQDIFKTLNIYDDMDVCVKFENDRLKIGPVMGMFMNENAVRRLSEGRPTVKMVEMANAAKAAKILIYFFTVGDVEWAGNVINAVFYKHETNTWERRKMPLPDVLYDRGGGFSADSLVKARELRKKLDGIPNLRKINARHYFDKWDLYCKLFKHKEMSVYLPETILYKNNLDEFRKMVDKYPTVYLKMCTGNNGKGVIRVRKESSLQYEYSYYKEGIVRGDVHSLDELIDIANKLMDNRSFIIQQGIDVLTYQNNKVDIRVLVQRDGRGVWRNTSMPVRIAVNDCAVTSTRSGSKVYPFEEAFCKILKFGRQQVESIKSDICKLISTAVNTLELEYGTFGELGIDVAVDKDQKLWFIESNAKPAKDTILIAGPRADIVKSFRLPFEYCKYLTGFQETNCVEVEEE